MRTFVILALVAFSVEAAPDAAGYVVKTGDFNSAGGDIRHYSGSNRQAGIEACNRDASCSLVVFTRGITWLKRLEGSGPYRPGAGGVSYVKTPHGGGTADVWGGVLGNFGSPGGDISAAYSNGNPFNAFSRCDGEGGCDLSVIQSGTTWDKRLVDSGEFFRLANTVSWIRSDHVLLEAIFEANEKFHGKAWDDQVQVFAALSADERTNLISEGLTQDIVQVALSVPSPATPIQTVSQGYSASPTTYMGFGVVCSFAVFTLALVLNKYRQKKGILHERLTEGFVSA